MSDLPELYLLAGGREERAIATRIGDRRYRVSIGERELEVDAARAGDAWSLIIDGQQVETTVARVESSDESTLGAEYWVATARGSHRVRVLEPLAYLTARRGGGPGRSRAGTVRTDMPGRVVSLLVAEGERVAAGQGILVVEAMKMENEIRSEAEGRVSRIYVEPGSAVESGDSLFDLAPLADE